MIDYALKYYDFGFNVTYINPSLNDAKRKKIYKAPSSDRFLLKNKRQNKEDIFKYKWEESSGLGLVLGYNKIRAIDIDFQSNLKTNGESLKLNIQSLIEEILIKLKLPKNYEWVVKTPSGGYHILFYCEKHNFKTEINKVSEYNELKTKALKPNQKTLSKYNGLGHFELRWDLHLVLPPSVDKFGVKYKFCYSEFPFSKPLQVDIKQIEKLFMEICLDHDVKTNRKGYNLFLSDYHVNHDYIDYKQILL